MVIETATQKMITDSKIKIKNIDSHFGIEPILISKRNEVT